MMRQKHFYMVFLVSVLLLFTSCISSNVDNSNVESSPRPYSTLIHQVPSANKEYLPKYKNVEFTLQNANNVLPEDILREVGYFGGGGEGEISCAPESYPAICDAPDVVDWPEGFWISSHSWKEGEEVTVSVTFPDNTELSETGQAYSSQEIFEKNGEIYWLQNYRYNYYLVPSTNNMLGEYTITFDGKSGHIEKKLLIRISPEPHMSILDLFRLSPESKIVLTGFSPNEHVRFFAYQSTKPEILEFVGWNIYVVDENGMLVIDTANSYDSNLHFAVFGEYSGLFASGSLKESIIIP